MNNFIIGVHASSISISYYTDKWNRFMLRDHAKLTYHVDLRESSLSLTNKYILFSSRNL